MDVASSGETVSSASSESTHSEVHRESAKFFCAANPRQGSVTKRALWDSATARVASVDPESTMTISSAQATLASVRGRFASSFSVTMATERVARGGISITRVWLEQKHRQCKAGRSSKRSRSIKGTAAQNSSRHITLSVLLLLVQGDGAAVPRVHTQVLVDGAFDDFFQRFAGLGQHEGAGIGGPLQ